MGISPYVRLKEINMSSASPCMAASVRAAGRKLTQFYDAVMAESGLRITQYSILQELVRCEHAPPTMGELAKSLVMDRSSLGQTLRPLERDGLIEFQRDATDGRRRPVALTDVGRAALAKAEPYWQQAQDAFVNNFGVKQSAKLRETLIGIANNDRIAVDHQ
jgi:DNA-binding MarR family transcriptional regulator